MASISRCGWIVILVALLSLAATATAATGMIQITVHPGNATVCLDTVCQGTAPGTGSTTFENVETGRYHMLNVYGTEGYKPYLGQVYLDLSGTSLAREISLEPLPPSAPVTGSFRVLVTPDGGKVCLDRMCEESSGDGTGSWSVQFTDIAANTYHTLAISHVGYGTYTHEIRLLPGETRTMTITLQPLYPGSTPALSPVPVATAAPGPQPTRAGLSSWVPLVAAGIGGLALVRGRCGRK